MFKGFTLHDSLLGLMGVLPGTNVADADLHLYLDRWYGGSAKAPIDKAKARASPESNSSGSETSLESVSPRQEQSHMPRREIPQASGSNGLVANAHVNELSIYLRQQLPA